jgi:hypothetical protein
MSIPLEPDRLKIFPEGAARRVPAPPPYASGVLGRLQNTRGEPSMRTRALAALVIVGLVVLTAPLVVLPVVHWLARFL